MFERFTSKMYDFKEKVADASTSAEQAPNDEEMIHILEDVENLFGEQVFIINH